MQFCGIFSRRFVRAFCTLSASSAQLGALCLHVTGALCWPGVTSRKMERPRGPQLGEMGEVGYCPPIFPATPTSPLGYNQMLSSGASGGFVMNPLTPAFVPEAQRVQHQCVRGHPPEQRMLMATCPSNIPSSMQAPLTAQFGYPWPQSAPPQQPWMPPAAPAQPQPAQPAQPAQPVPSVPQAVQPVQAQSRTVAAAAAKEMMLEEKKLHASQVRQSQGRDLNQASQQGLQAVEEMLSAAFKRATPVLAKLPPGVVPVEAPEKSPLPFVELDRSLLQKLEEADRLVQAAAAAKKTENLRKEREVPSEVAARSQGQQRKRKEQGKGRQRSKQREGQGQDLARLWRKGVEGEGGLNRGDHDHDGSQAPALGQEGALHRWLLEAIDRERCWALHESRAPAALRGG
eukprot:s3792_g4.t1